MKNLIKKVRHHGKKITIYLKSQPKWVVRCMFGIGAILGLVLSLHTHPIGGTNAQTPEAPTPRQCEGTIGGWNLYDTLKKYSDVHYYTGNITYTGVEGSVFTGIGTITISSGDSIITILDRNLGATTNDIESTGSYGYTIPFSGDIDNFTNDIQLCPDGFHVPSYQEWEEITNMLGNDGEYLSENLLLPYIGLWSSSENNRCGATPCTSGEQAMSVFVAVPVDCPVYSNTGRSLHGTPNGEYGIRCFYDENQEYHPFIINLYDGETVIDTLEIWAGNDITLPILENSGDVNFDGWFIDSELTIPFDDTITITGDLDLYAKWSDMTPPTCSIGYSTTGWTNQNVTATLTCNEAVTVTNNESSTGYTFENTGTFLFEFQDLAGNTGEELAEVTWIDKIAPTCNIAYNTTGSITGNVVASLTGCSETITGTDLQYTFTGNGTYTFNFQDLAGNTGSTGAEVTWITSGNNTIYFDIEGNEFRWDELTVCNPYDSRVCITMMDKNLGATTNDIENTGSYGFYYQWGNNYGFLPNLESLMTGENPVDASSYGPGNYYNSGVYIISPRNETYARDRSNVKNDNLWGGSGDDLDNNYLGYPVQNPTNRQGPCPDGYHVPSMGERLKVVEWWALNYNGSGYGDSLIYDDLGRPVLSGGILAFKSDFFIPESKSFYTRRREYEEKYDIIEGLYTRLHSSTPYSYSSYCDLDGCISFDQEYRDTFGLFLDFSHSRVDVGGIQRDMAAPIRCFKNNTGYNKVDDGIRFYIDIDKDIKPGEYTTFTVKALKNGEIYNNYTGAILFTLTNNDGGLVNKRLYTIYNSGHYTFESADGGRKVFYSGLKITEAGTYILEIRGLENGGIGSGVVLVGKKHNSFDFKYNTLSFNPNYSDEMNEAYQFARYYTITTKDNIKEADMYGGLSRIAMAKMLANYAEGVLGINNYNTGRNCKFTDVSTGLDKEYYYGVTKACQLGIMGVNMPNNKFYPEGGVTRAEFATALSRLLYGTPDGVGQYYSTHLVKLYQEKIITNTDPTLQELRGYVMLMLMRAAK